MDPDSFTADAEISGLLKSLAETPHVRPFLGTERYRVVQCLGEGGFGVVSAASATDRAYQGPGRCPMPAKPR